MQYPPRERPGYWRILKQARTIADLGSSRRIETVHLAEAIHLRPARQAL
jgi:predicted ATPase with chaperone activity